MGCDIHLYVEVRENGVWVPQGKMEKNEYYDANDPDDEEVGEREFRFNSDQFYSERNYNLFSILANVRNGYGFAGCDTGDGFVPIALPRGLPSDVSTEIAGESERWGPDGHSHSYFTVEEILAFDWTQKTKSRGWINGIEAEHWLRMRVWEPEPHEYSGGVSGPNIQHISMQEMEHKIESLIGGFRDKGYRARMETYKAELGNTYTLAEWEVQYAKAAGHFWTHTLPKLLNLGNRTGFTYEDVRIVFWFDN